MLLLLVLLVLALVELLFHNSSLLVLTQFGEFLVNLELGVGESVEVRLEHRRQFIPLSSDGFILEVSHSHLSGTLSLL